MFQNISASRINISTQYKSVIHINDRRIATWQRTYQDKLSEKPNRYSRWQVLGAILDVLLRQVMSCGDGDGGENVPGIPDACATRKFTYLARGLSRCIYMANNIWHWYEWELIKWDTNGCFTYHLFLLCVAYKISTVREAFWFSQTLFISMFHTPFRIGCILAQ